MNHFNDYFTNANYARAYAKMQGCDGIVLIESEKDIRFWQTLFKQTTDKCFLFQPGVQQNRAARSKKLFEDKYVSANEAVMIAIDSDFDYLASNRSDVAKQINSNRYVLQTYAYSVESLNFCAATLDHCMENTWFFLTNDHRLGDFISHFSQLVYPVLVKYLYLLDTRVDNLLYPSDLEMRSSEILSGFNSRLVGAGRVIPFQTNVTTKWNRSEAPFGWV